MPFLRWLAYVVMAPVVTGLAFFTATTCLLLDLGRGRVSNAVARLWGRAMLAVAGARLVVRGAERVGADASVVIAPNHTSYLDIPAVLASFPGQVRILARSTLRWMPFVGWYLALAGHFFVDRENPRQALALMGRMAERMRRRRLSVLLYPEGTRSQDGRLQPLKPGAFWLPAQIGAPVLPVAILGTHEILPKRAWGPRRGGTVEVRYGDPVAVEGRAGSAGRKDLAADVTRALLALGVPAGAEASAADDAPAA